MQKPFLYLTNGWTDCVHVRCLRQVAARNLWMGEDIKQAVDARRIHHQLMPDVLKVEEGTPQV